MKVYAVTILGSPAAECAHYGICKIEKISQEAWDAFQPTHFRYVKAGIFLSKENGRLSFEFPMLGMRSDTFKRFFATGCFRLDAAGYLPENVAKAICTEARIILPKVYPLVLTETAILLEVEVGKEAMLLESDFTEEPPVSASSVVS